MLGQETRDLGAMIIQQGYKSSFMIFYGHSRLDRPNEKFCWVHVQRKKIEGSSGRMISILYYFMLQKQCHWTCVNSHIRAGDRCAIYAHVYLCL